MAPKGKGRPRATVSVAELPRGSSARTRLLPSWRSVLCGLALVALGAGGYAVARETAVFAIQRIDVVGAAPEVAAEVRQALRPLEGASLVAVRAEELDRRVAALPMVVSATYDRAFPHTLRVFVRPERPLAVVRRGRESWLVSARARVLRRLARGARPQLPRVWVPATVDVGLGETLTDRATARAIRALVPLEEVGFPVRVRSVRAEAAQTALVLATGAEIRLGRDSAVRLKLAVAAAVVPRLERGPLYLDVSVPRRPVAGPLPQPQLELKELEQ